MRSARTRCAACSVEFVASSPYSALQRIASIRRPQGLIRTRGEAMLNAKSHVVMQAGLRNEGRVFVRYLSRVGVGAAAIAAATIALGSLQSGVTRQAAPAGLQVGHGQFGDRPATTLEAGMAMRVEGVVPAAADSFARREALVFEVYDDSTGELIARMPDSVETPSVVNDATTLARK
jgi:hypothetical protein